MANDVSGIDLPDEASNLLFDLPLSVDEEGRDDNDDKDGAEQTDSNLRIAQSVIRFGALGVIVAARRLV